MKFILKLKHWQLFLFTWGLPIIIDIFSFSNPMILVQLFPLMMIFFAIGIFGWVWAIATVLHKKLPTDVNLNLGRFKIYFLIPIVYVLALSLWLGFRFYYGNGFENESAGTTADILIFLHLFSMVCIFLGLRFAAKTMKSVELGRVAKFGDYAGEFFLIWFSFIGVWVLQPRLNKLST
jgi:hypothetical protein